ncbi:MAG: xylose isomerase [Spirochaetota bacterium]
MSYFTDIPTIPYEGPESTNPLAFKYFNADEKVGGKTMKEHLRFSIAYWHTMNGRMDDQFGAGTAIRPWDSVTNPMDQAKARMDALFEILDKLGVEYFCFHDRDIAPEGETLAETNKNLDEIVEHTKKLMDGTSIKLLWGTACLFTHPRFVHGASTSCNADVFAYAAAQVKKALEVTKYLGGTNYVFWGGREGYETLLNTNLGLELDNMGRFMRMAVDYAKEIGFTGQFLIEPKPMEPTKHQYDSDVAACHAFLQKYDLTDYFKMNLEQNHAVLAGHTFSHELRYARENKMLGSMDVNQGDYLLGWDTDQMPTNIHEATLAMYEVLSNGGIAPGGMNFDAHVRRGSFQPDDIFMGHIAGMDAYARGLKAAYSLHQSREIEDFIAKRYSSYTTGIGKKIVDGQVGFKELEEYAMQNSKITNSSGRQEMLEGIVSRHI